MKMKSRRKEFKISAVSFALFAMTAVLLCAAGCSERSKTVRIGTAGIGGNYYSFGKAYAQFLMDDIRNADVQVKVTPGSKANLRLITKEKPEIELAIMQADVIADLANTRGSSPGFSAVAGLYTEAVQIVTREDSDIYSLSDLKGRTISVGEKESGTEKNALQLMNICGLSGNMFKTENLNYAKAAEALENGGIDAFFCTAGIKTAVIQSLAKKIPIRLVSVREEEVDALTDTYTYYVPYSIPAGTYNGQKQDIQTVGIKSVLVASDTLSEDMVKKITQSLFQHAEELRYSFLVNFEPDPYGAVEDLPLQLHSGAEAWYKENGINIIQ